MLEKVHYVPKSLFNRVRNKIELIEKALEIWKSIDPQEVDDFDRAMEGVGDADYSKSIVPLGKIPANLFNLINIADKEFFDDPKNIRLLFKQYTRARVRREIRKIMVVNA